MGSSLSIKSIKSLVPLLDRVLVHRVKAVEKTASGLFLPSTASAGPVPEALVIAVGPGAPNRDGVLVPVALKAGDRVVLPGFGGVGVKVGDEEYTLFRDVEILAKINAE